MMSGPTAALYSRGVHTTRDFGKFLREALRGKFDPSSTLAMSRRFLRTIENIFSQMIPKEITDQSSTTLEGLKKKIFSTIDNLQHPSTCGNVINCRVATQSGVSSGLHDILYCLVVGLQRNKTVALDVTRWANFSKNPWRLHFLDLGACPTAPQNEDIRLTGEYRRRMKFLPTNLAAHIIDNHGDPYAWWYGVLMSYILRPGGNMESTLDDYSERILPKSRMHIRRTDKAGEALYRPLESYVAEAEEYFARISLTREVCEKLVYVATDDPRVLDELEARFKSFEFVFNENTARTAFSYGGRRTAAAVMGIAKDYHMLSHADHLVCTLSSGFCRVAYELMNAVRHDAWARISSLDNDFYYAYVLQEERQAVEPYEDGVFAAEIRKAHTSDVPESFQQMITVTLSRSYSPFGADGFAFTNDDRKMTAKFKTSLPYPSMSFESNISRIIV
ncbi:alpha-(1,6)-fucosyltransferase-like [Galendromus occidentalis]|uniref:Alpha-(1,6)-fucosyltransferase-like n=1 Tax=Galendromus occidentalis TaxID=34638 RepID=A0AAJ7SJG4_9ACAR|nr:alpha-(1,6)-fucosyltransferase-like [Galendromus occidentalis]